MAQKIRTQYMEKTPSELDALRELDAKVKRPANVFAYIFGSISAIVMGAGMSLVMTDIGATIGITSALVPGIARRWQDDTRLRVNVSLYGSLAWNALYGIFQLWLGFYHHTFWFYSLGAYYICLGVMRFFLVRHTTRYAPGERLQTELKKYRACGIVFLVMNLALALIIFFMVYWNRTFQHHMITAIAMAAYTFTALTTAIINVIKYRKYNSPVFSASKAISLAAALVSMLTLESTMLTTFGDGTMTAIERKWMLGATGGVVSLLIVATAIYMIVVGTKKLKQLKTEVNNG